ncbi:MAG: xanthine dehydrogenase family protein molybdopterin-binding subunit [Opitutaceae bacterium]
MLRPGGWGASLATLDVTRAARMPGVTVVHEGDFAGVVASDAVTASRALEAIRADWKIPAQPSSAALFQHLAEHARTPSDRDQRDTGSISKGLERADHRLVQTYTIAYIAHAPLETRAALADWKDDRVTVWTGTQRPFGVRSEVARALGVPENRVRIIVPDTGSGYGGKHTGEAAIEAARLSRAAGAPVKVEWSREEEFTRACARPAGVIEVRAGVRRDGTITAWECRNINSGGSGLGSPYRTENESVAFQPSDSPLRHGSYRALASTANHFARESHIDDLAHALGMDPVAFRLKKLKEPRLRAVVEAAAKKFGWSSFETSDTRGRGIGCGTEKGSFIATCAEVEIDRERGAVRVVRVVSAYECGAVVNPAHLLNQVEGAIVQGIGGALFEELRFADGRMLNPRFSQYRLPRFRDAPLLETELLNRPDLPSAGAGETPIIGIAPAIRNAIASAAGVRLHALPMIPHGLPATT